MARDLPAAARKLAGGICQGRDVKAWVDVGPLVAEPAGTLVAAGREVFGRVRGGMGAATGRQCSFQCIILTYSTHPGHNSLPACTFSGTGASGRAGTTNATAGSNDARCAHYSPIIPGSCTGGRQQQGGQSQNQLCRHRRDRVGTEGATKQDGGVAIRSWKQVRGCTSVRLEKFDE